LTKDKAGIAYFSRQRAVAVEKTCDQEFYLTASLEYKNRKKKRKYRML
jgi:hypothetical protein